MSVREALPGDWCPAGLGIPGLGPKPMGCGWLSGDQVSNSEACWRQACPLPGAVSPKAPSVLGATQQGKGLCSSSVGHVGFGTCQFRSSDLE